MVMTAEKRGPDDFYITRVRFEDVVIPEEVADFLGLPEGASIEQATEVKVEEWDKDFPTWEDAIKELQERHLVNPEDWMIDDVALLTTADFWERTRTAYIIRCDSASPSGGSNGIFDVMG